MQVYSITLKYLRMRTTILLSMFLVIGFVSCNKNNAVVEKSTTSFLDTLTFSHSMKGWELYSWQNGNDWSYSVLMGTNRGKSYTEITTNKILVTGKSSLKMLLAKLPSGEDILWRGKGWLSNDLTTVSLPDDNTINEIQEFCTQKGLGLHVSK
jgi:hypothetical protein